MGRELVQELHFEVARRRLPVLLLSVDSGAESLLATSCILKL